MEENKKLLDKNEESCSRCICCRKPGQLNGKCCQFVQIQKYTANGWRRRSEPCTAWLKLAAVFIINVTVMTYCLSFGIMYDSLQEKYDCGRAAIGLVLVVSSVMFSIAGLMAAPTVAMYGCRPVAMTSACLLSGGVALSSLAPTLVVFVILYGAIGGMGFGGVYVASLSVVQQYFSYNRGLATAVSAIGFTVGTALVPILVDYLLRTNGTSGTLLLLGAVLAQVVVFTALLKSPGRLTRKGSSSMKSPERQLPIAAGGEDPYILVDDNGNVADMGNSVLCGGRVCERNDATTPLVSQGNVDLENNEVIGESSEKTASNDQETPSTSPVINLRRELSTILHDFFDLALIKNVPYVLCVILKCLLTVTTLGINAHAVSAATFKGTSQQYASYLLSMVGVCNLVTRLLTTVAMGYDGVGPVVYVCLGAALLTASGFLLAFAETYSTFVGAMVLMGAYEGITFVSLFLVVVQLIGQDKYDKSFAIFSLSILPSSFIGVPLTGWLKDATGNYFASFLTLGAFAAVATLIAVVIQVVVQIKHMKCGK